MRLRLCIPCVACRWDEDTYGLEYDLDLFNIVAVDDFNMGEQTCWRWGACFA